MNTSPALFVNYDAVNFVQGLCRPHKGFAFSSSCWSYVVDAAFDYLNRNILEVNLFPNIMAIDVINCSIINETHSNGPRPLFNGNNCTTIPFTVQVSKFYKDNKDYDIFRKVKKILLGNA